MLLRHRGTNRGRRGFTLLEMLVVMTIIAIAFFAVRPNLTRALQADRERAAVRHVVALLQSARTEAVAKGRLVRVEMGVRQQELWAERQAAPDPLAAVTTTAAAGAQASDYREHFDPIVLLGRARLRLPEYLEISEVEIGGAEAGAGGGMVYFFPDGRTTGARVALSGRTGQEFVVELSPTTGKVRIRE